MPLLAYFGIESSGLNLAVDLLIVFLVVLYLSLVYWTYADARRRIEDPMLVGCATASSLFFPYVGTIIYIIVRPSEYLEDVRERELEIQAAEARLYELDVGLCPHCDYRIERDFIRCPSCLRKLKERCASCSRPLEQTWAICPYCEAEVPGSSASRRARRRRSSGLEGEPSELTPPRTRAGTDALDASLDRADRAARALEESGADDEEDLRAPVAATEPAAGTRGGRATRPGGRQRPSS